MCQVVIACQKIPIQAWVPGFGAANVQSLRPTCRDSALTCPAKEAPSHRCRKFQDGLPIKHVKLTATLPMKNGGKREDDHFPFLRQSA